MTDPRVQPHDGAPPDDASEALLDELFERAVDAGATGAPLDLSSWCAAHPHLAERAREVLAIAAEVAVVTPLSCRTTGPPTIAGFTLEGEVGRGSMGVVYRARQAALGRVVALKVLAPSLVLSERARERFRAEARALARIRHPHVVTIHEVLAEGAVSAYAMEWVDGSTLAAAIAREGAGLDARRVAALGAAVARALQAVHAAGLVHRDVKPSNILLRADGTPLLSDFSLVRDRDAAHLTATGEFLGTLAYSAPEQVRGEHQRVGPRSDVYSLGVTLYAAVAGRAPFRGSSTGEVLKQIEDGHTEPLERAAPHVPRDLATVITKAMALEPAQRYASAAALAEDLERFLRHEPVLARGLGAHVRALRFARRRPGLVTSCALALLLVVGTPSALFLQQRSALARERALRAEADTQGKAAEAARARAEDEASIQREVTAFLRGLIQRGDTTRAKGRADITLREAIDEASTELLAAGATRRPQVEYAIRNTIADVYIAAGRFEEAAQHLAVAEAARHVVYSDDSEEAASTAYHMGRIYQQSGRLADAARLFAEAARVRRVLAAQQVGLESHGAQRLYLAQAINALGIVRRRLGDSEGALGAYAEARALYMAVNGPHDESVGMISLSLATLHSLAGRHAEAERCARSALLIASNFHRAPPDSPPHRDLSLARARLGTVLSVAGRYDEAGPLLRRAVWDLRAAVGCAHRDTIDAAYELACHIERVGRIDDQADLLRRVLAWCEALEPLGSQRSLRVTAKLADALAATGGHAEAEGLLVRAIAAAGAAAEEHGLEAKLAGLRAAGR